MTSAAEQTNSNASSHSAFAPVAVAEMSLVASGSLRLIYEHPAFPDALIKVYKAKRITPDGQFVYGRSKPWRFKLRRRMGAHALSHREIGEYLAFQARFAARAHERPLAATHGLIETDQGLGLIVEKLTAPDGSMAPTLASLLAQKRFTAAHHQALRHFFHALEDFQVCVNDLHAKNIVFTGTAGADGRFVAVDGIGLRSAIQVQDWFKWVNAIQVRKRAIRIWRYVEGNLDPHDPLRAEVKPPKRFAFLSSLPAA